MVPADEEVFTTWVKDVEGTDVSVLYLCGELDASNVPAFLNDMHGIMNSRKHLIVDTHLLSYIDSTGLGALFSVKQALAAKGYSTCLVGVHGLLGKILDISRLSRDIRSYETEDEAAAELTKSGW